MRQIGSSEAFWRIYVFCPHNQFPSCITLSVHWHKQQKVYFEEDLVKMMNQEMKDTQLAAFYKLNHSEPNRPNIKHKYVNFPEKYTWM